MVLFFVLLGICFAPFIAFSQVNHSILLAKNTNSIQKDVFLAPIQAEHEVVDFDVKKVNNQLEFTFSSEFDCTSYAIEGKVDGEEEFSTLFYCNNGQCMNAKESIQFKLWLDEYPYSEFRVKAQDENGEIVYSDSKQIESLEQKEVDFVSSAVFETLILKSVGIQDLALELPVAQKKAAE
ncbi:MAG: hypothetical protein R2852_03070 [Bacteroidia bacterium]